MEWIGVDWGGLGWMYAPKFSQRSISNSLKSVEKILLGRGERSDTFSNRGNLQENAQKIKLVNMYLNGSMSKDRLESLVKISI